MSDSESGHEERPQIDKEERAAHLQSIIQRGKQIMPSYDDDALLALYKQYYEMDNLFLDNLELHAKKLRIDTEEAGQGDWIEVKCNNKVEVRKREKKAVTADRYNFLEDAARRLSDILVLLRAKNYEQRNEVVHHKNQRQHGSFVEKRINGDNTQQVKNGEGYDDKQRNFKGNRGSGTSGRRKSFVEKKHVNGHKDVKYFEKETNNKQKAVYVAKDKSEVKQKEKKVNDTQINEPVKEVSKQIIKQTLKEASKEVIKSTPKQTSNDVLKYIPKETIKECPKQTPNQAAKYTPKETSRYIIKETAPKQTAKYVPKECPKQTPNQAAKYTPKETSRYIIKETAPKQTAKYVPKQTLEQPKETIKESAEAYRPKFVDKAALKGNESQKNREQKPVENVKKEINSSQRSLEETVSVSLKQPLSFPKTEQNLKAYLIPHATSSTSLKSPPSRENMQSPSRREVGSKVTTATAKEIEANKLAPEIEKQFSESQRLFPLVLKYLKPSQKLNHISYVLEQNGTIKNVKRLEPIQSKQVL